jgi:hypothetical protein
MAPPASITASALRRWMGLTLVASALGVGVLVLSLWRPGPAMARVGQKSCPHASALEYPTRPRGAIPAAKSALGSTGRVLQVRSGPGSTYAAAAKRLCGARVLRDSVYVIVHPTGITCSACDLHAYVVKFREGEWRVWTAY